MLLDCTDLRVLLREQNRALGGGSSVVVDATLFAEVGGFATDLRAARTGSWIRLADRS